MILKTKQHCRYPAMVEISFINSCIRIVMRISIKTQSAGTRHTCTSHLSKNLVKIRAQPRLSYPADRQTDRQKHRQLWRR